jgi:acyl-CoA reductase-like NAD-dependent aldehyde dehydrogenase
MAKGKPGKQRSNREPQTHAGGLHATYPWYLANKPVAAKADYEVLDKYSGKVATRVPVVGAAEVRKAIVAAHKAREAMAEFPPDARRDVLEHCVRRFGERREELALALCIEAGKPIRDARGEVDRLIDTFRIAAGEATRPPGEVMNLTVSPRTRGYRGLVKRVPVGVCSFITPFNFPLNLVAHKVAPAIAAGCPFVLKPALKTPVGALIIGEVLAETDLPKGAFSVLNCSNEDAAILVEDERIALLSFTGSLLGWDLKGRAGRKKVTLELGGNAACIVDADPGADLEHVVDRLVFGAYYQSGQSCISVQRILVHADVYPALRKLLKKKVAGLRMGNPRDEDTFIGPVIDEDAAARIESWIAAAERKGAKRIAGGKRKGTLLPATLLEEQFERLTRQWERPAFAIDRTTVDGRRVPVSTRVAWERPFCRLLHFQRATSRTFSGSAMSMARILSKTWSVRTIGNRNTLRWVSDHPPSRWLDPTCS